MNEFIYKAIDVQKELGITRSQHQTTIKKLEEDIHKKLIKRTWMLNVGGKRAYAAYAQRKSDKACKVQLEESEPIHETIGVQKGDGFIYRAIDVQKELGITRSQHQTIVKKLVEGTHKKLVKRTWMLNEAGRKMYSARFHKKDKERPSVNLKKDDLEKYHSPITGKTYNLAEHVFKVGGERYYRGYWAAEILKTNRMTVYRILKRGEVYGRRFSYSELKDQGLQHPNSRGQNMLTEVGFHALVTRSEGISAQNKMELLEDLKLKGLLKEGVSYVLPNRPEIEFLDELEEVLTPFKYKCIRQYRVLDCRIDLYIEDLNIAIEYDENDHLHYDEWSHEIRQECIEKELGCRFIRVSDKNSNLHNVGVVMKEIFMPKA